jgi:hypothetical protein
MGLTIIKWLLTTVVGLTLFSMPDSKADFHPVYISVTEINHNAADKNLEIACKIFTDDFEIVLAKAFNTKVDLFHPKDSILTEKQIGSYIARHLALKLDGKPVTLKIIGYEREQDALWSYFEVNNVPAPPKQVSIMNNLLYENFPQQINLLHVTIGGKRKSTKLDNPDENVIFNW